MCFILTIRRNTPELATDLMKGKDEGGSEEIPAAAAA
jgi:hypothetical protein